MIGEPARVTGWEVVVPLRTADGAPLWFTSAALRSLVGQRPTVNGQPGEVLDAWRGEDGVQIRLRVEGPLPGELADGLGIEWRDADPA